MTRRTHALLALAVAGACAAGLGCQEEDEGFNWDNAFPADAGGGTGPLVPGGTGSGPGTPDAGGGAGPDTGGNSTCPSSSDNRVEYLFTTIADCRSETLNCTGTRVPFQSSCGCGCIERTLGCPPSNDSRVTYLSTDRRTCGTGSPTCLPGETTFNDACGCGCIRGTETACNEAELFGIDRGALLTEIPCDAVTVCLNDAVTASIRQAVATAFPTADCDADVSTSCPAGTVASCVGALGVAGRQTLTRLCGLQSQPQVLASGCGTGF